MIGIVPAGPVLPVPTTQEMAVSIMNEMSLPPEVSESGGTWADTVNMVLGVWLFCAPPALHIPLANPQAWISIGFGVLLGGMAGAAMVTARVWKEGAILVIGMVMIAVPWLFGYSDEPVPMWNNLACGSLVVAFAAGRLYDLFEKGHHDRRSGMPPVL